MLETVTTRVDVPFNSTNEQFHVLSYGSMLSFSRNANDLSNVLSRSNFDRRICNIRSCEDSKILNVTSACILRKREKKFYLLNRFEMKLLR